MSNAPPPSGDVALPDVVGRYLRAHDRRDTDSALAAFTPDARVHDDGHEYVGTDEIRYWLASASTQFTYTRIAVEATAIGTDQWQVLNHLEGRFPGGLVDLRYRFVVAGGLISELVIAV